MNVVIITGASSGIGKAAAEKFADKGWCVYDLSRHGSDSITSKGNAIRHLDCDVTQEADCMNAVKTVVEQCGHINVLISNAGIGISGALEFTDLSDARKQMDVNFFGAMNIAKSCIPYMRQSRLSANERCSILFVSSMASVFSIPFQSFYSASKFAVNGMALALQNELRPFGIKVACLLPGDVKTGFTDARNKSYAGSEVYTHMNASIAQMEKDEVNGIEPRAMADKLYGMASSSCTPFFNTVGLQYHLFAFANKILPTTLVNYIVGKLY